MCTSYVLQNRVTGLMARYDCLGQHDGLFTDDIAAAAEFPTFGECAEYGQNFDDSWHPQATHLTVPPIECRRAIAAQVPSY